MGHLGPRLPHTSGIRDTPDLLDLHGDPAAERGGETLSDASGLTESDRDSLCACLARHAGPSLGPVKSILKYVDFNGCLLDSRGDKCLCRCHSVDHDVAVANCNRCSTDGAIVRIKSGSALPNVRD